MQNILLFSLIYSYQVKVGKIHYILPPSIETVQEVCDEGDVAPSTGGEEGYVPAPDSSDTDTLKTDTLKTTKTVSSDYSTLGRLRKNIRELDTLIDSLEDSEQGGEPTTNASAEAQSETVVVVAKQESKVSTQITAPAPEVAAEPALALTLATAQAQSQASPSSRAPQESHIQTVVETRSSTTSQQQVAKESKWVVCGVPLLPHAAPGSAGSLPGLLHLSLLSSPRPFLCTCFASHECDLFSESVKGNRRISLTI